MQFRGALSLHSLIRNLGGTEPGTAEVHADLLWRPSEFAVHTELIQLVHIMTGTNMEQSRAQSDLMVISLNVRDSFRVEGGFHDFRFCMLQ